MKRYLILLVVLTMCAEVKRAEKMEISETIKVGKKADIYIDVLGIPHIFAESLEEAFFAQGYIVGRMRLWQVDSIRRTAKGMLSSLIDVPEALEQDKFTLTIMTARDGKKIEEKIWNRLKGKEEAKLIRAYVDGLNAYLKRLKGGDGTLPHEYTFLGLTVDDIPEFTPQDIIAIARFQAWYLSSTYDEEKWFGELKDKLPNNLLSLYLRSAPADRVYTLPQFYSCPRCSPPASNNWVISGGVSSTGRPILANDPHLRFTNPPLWYAVHIKTSDIELAGFTIACLPGIMIGTNGHIAWGVTNTGYDVLDIYKEEKVKKTNCESGYAVVFQGKKVCILKVEHKIETRGGPESVTVFVVPHHGPMIGDVSIRWTGHEETREIEGSLGLLKARNVDEALLAIKKFDIAALNFVLADQHNIAYASFAMVPRREWDLYKYPPYFPLPGTGCCEWTGWLELDKLPHAKNLDFIATANNDLVGITDDNDPFNEGHYLYFAYDIGFRIGRITEVLSQQAGKLSVDDMKKLQLDIRSRFAARIVPYIVSALEQRNVESEALDILKTWNFTCPSGYKVRFGKDGKPVIAGGTLVFDEDDENIGESYSASLFWTLISILIEKTFKDEFEKYTGSDYFKESYAVKSLLYMLESGNETFFDDVNTPETEHFSDIVLSSFEEAIEKLSRRMWRWGDLHKIVVSHFFSMAGLPIFDLGPYPVEGCRFTPNTSWFSLKWEEQDVPFRAIAGPSLRVIMSANGNGFKILWSMPGGQSGFNDPKKASTLREINLENNFGDILPYWLSGLYLDFPMKIQSKLGIALR